MGQINTIGDEQNASEGAHDEGGQKGEHQMGVLIEHGYGQDEGEEAENEIQNTCESAGGKVDQMKLQFFISRIRDLQRHLVSRELTK